MDFFNSLTLDLKVLVVGLAGCALLALFAGNQKSEKRYMLLFTVLAAVSVYRFVHLPADDHLQSGATVVPASRSLPEAPAHRPLESTSAR